MASRYSTDFVKLRHKSCVFTPKNVAKLQKALEKSDLVSLVFLTCGNCQISDMFNFLNSENCTSMDLYRLLQTFPAWERKLPEALGVMEHKLGLKKLDISPKDQECHRRIKDSEMNLCPGRLALYRILEALTKKDGNKLIAEMLKLGAPLPPLAFSQLELHFMFWHSQGYLNIARRDNFDIIAKSLESIGKPYLEDFFTSPQIPLDNYVFDIHPLGIYNIKNPKNLGLCVIINQVRYGGEKADRESSIVNSNDLQHLMESLDFTVISMEDLTKAEFCKNLRTAVASGFSEEHSIFMLIVMGHGGPEGLFCPLENQKDSCPGEKGDNYPRNEKGDDSDLKINSPIVFDFVRVEDIQNSLFACKELERIPKVLILNMCRGQMTFTTRMHAEMAHDAPGCEEIYSRMNIITCYSALPDFVSHRDLKKGSLFIQLFCEILSKRPDMEICELFTLMNARLMTPTADMSQAFQPGRYAYENKVALPFEWTSSLTKKLYFKLPEATSAGVDVNAITS